MSRYTEKLILQTFGEMLEEMPFDKITVSALTRRSDVSHNTFYYHYKDIYDLLEVWVRRELAPYLQADSGYPNWESAVKAMLTAWQSDARVVYHVFNSLSREQLERYVYESADDLFLGFISTLPNADCLSEKQRQQIADFTRDILLGFLLRFIWNRMESNVDESVSELSVLLNSFIAHAIADYCSGKLEI